MASARSLAMEYTLPRTIRYAAFAIAMLCIGASIGWATDNVRFRLTFELEVGYPVTAPASASITEAAQTPVAAPSATETPQPAPMPPSSPSAASTALPAATLTATPTASATPRPSQTPVAVPRATETPQPTPSPSPAATRPPRARDADYNYTFDDLRVHVPMNSCYFNVDGTASFVFGYYSPSQIRQIDFRGTLFYMGKQYKSETVRYREQGGRVLLTFNSVPFILGSAWRANIDTTKCAATYRINGGDWR